VQSHTLNYWMSWCAEVPLWFIGGRGFGWLESAGKLLPHPAIHGHRRSTLASFGWPLLAVGGWPGVGSYLAKAGHGRPKAR
jgi:hypothetical protein